MLSQSEILLRLVAGALLGATIGYEREARARAAGLRTHLLVGLAGATFMVLSTEFSYWQGDSAAAKYVDPSRIAAAVVAGIGFLAGGAILRTGVSVRGLTTAAGLWLVTAIGLCAGSGMYLTAGSVTLLGLVALAVLRFLEDNRARRRLTIELSSNADAELQRLEEQLDGLEVSLEVISHERKIGHDAQQVLILEVRGNSDRLEQVVERLCSADGVRSVCLSRLHEAS
ncbi:MAG: MgtC/SapB family protein [Polyangiaceae bacterium]